MLQLRRSCDQRKLQVRLQMMVKLAPGVAAAWVVAAAGVVAVAAADAAGEAAILTVRSHIKPTSRQLPGVNLSLMRVICMSLA